MIKDSTCLWIKRSVSIKTRKPSYFNGYIQERKEGNILFKRRTRHILFTVIWRRTYGKVPFSENPAAVTTWARILCMPISDRIAHTTAFITPVVEHWVEREIAQWVHHERTLYHEAASRSGYMQIFARCVI